MRRDDTRVLKFLMARYPTTFFQNPRYTKPILEEVVEQLAKKHEVEFDAAQIRASIAMYRNSRHYHKAVAVGRERIQLDGKAIDQPSADEQQQAKDWLSRWPIARCCEILYAESPAPEEKAKLIDILESDFRELTVLSSMAARSPAQSSAFSMRSQMVSVAKTLVDADPAPYRIRDLQYARYYEAVSGCNARLLAHDFTAARSWANSALEASQHFRQSRSFFPNFFIDEKEIETHGTFVDAVCAFRDGRFRDASNSLQEWLTLNNHRKGRGDTHYDCNLVHHKLCLTLAEIEAGAKSDVLWNELEQMARSPHFNLHRTTRALLDHMDAIKGLSQIPEPHIPGGRATVKQFSIEAQKYWRLLSPSAPLKGKDRAAGLEEIVRLPSFLDAIELAQSTEAQWSYLLLQIFRNSLILKADYELRLRHLHPETRGLPAPTINETFEIERLGDKILAEFTRTLISDRDQGDLGIFDRAIPSWRDAIKCAEAEDQNGAIAHFDKFATILRSFPHVIRVESCVEKKKITHLDSEIVRFDVIAKRVWRYSPGKLELDTEHAVANTYAYMRPRWNRNVKPRFRIRESFEPVIQSRVPEWMVLFEQWASDLGPVPAEVFLRWCSQIEPRWRTVALRLLTRMTVLSENDVRDAWRSLYREQLPAEAKKRVLYVGIGRAEKSGVHQLYPLKQAISSLTEGAPDFPDTNAFRSADSIEREEPDIESVVFVDDFIGSGRQATRYLSSLMERAPWIKRRRVYLAVLAGFEDGVFELQNYLSQISGRLLVAKTLTRSDRAFAERDSFWDSESDREDAKRWCRTIGEALLQGSDLDPVEHALGWRGSEALIAFHHNTPNNTLPLFWAKGSIHGKHWAPLFPRFS